MTSSHHRTESATSTQTEEQGADKYAAPADNFPRSEGSGSGTSKAYSVEARLAYVEPQKVCGHLLDLRWRRIWFAKSPIGVPNSERLNFGVHSSGLYSYAAAQALRWWFHAQAETESGGFCVETRLVEHQVKYSFSSTATAAHDLIGGNDRSNIMPPRTEDEPR